MRAPNFVPGHGVLGLRAMAMRRVDTQYFLPMDSADAASKLASKLFGVPTRDSLDYALSPFLRTLFIVLLTSEGASCLSSASV